MDSTIEAEAPTPLGPGWEVPGNLGVVLAAHPRPGPVLPAGAGRGATQTQNGVAAGARLALGADHLLLDQFAGLDRPRAGGLEQGECAVDGGELEGGRLGHPGRPA